MSSVLGLLGWWSCGALRRGATTYQVDRGPWGEDFRLQGVRVHVVYLTAPLPSFSARSEAPNAGFECRTTQEVPYCTSND